jgi:2-keto-4-pentenoate hydratase
VAEAVPLDDWVSRQLSDYDRHQPGRMFEDETLSLSISEAYEIQRRVAALRQQRGEAVAGYKIGCVSQPVRQQLALNHPVFGHVFSSELHPSGCFLSWAGYEGLAIEGEYAVRLGADVPNGDWLLENPPRAIQSFFPVIELHNFIFRGATQTAQELIANNAIHAGVVLPAAEIRYREPGDLRNASIQVLRNGNMVGKTGDGILHDDLPSRLASLSAHLAETGTLLRKDQIVLTGTPLPLYRVSPGDRIEVCCPDLPPVTATIAADF